MAFTVPYGAVIQKEDLMNVTNEATKQVQQMVDEGTLAFFGPDHLAYYGKTGGQVVGKVDDPCTVLNTTMALIKANK